MPDTHWNRIWAIDFRRFARGREVGYYGQQWGDPSLAGWRYWLAKLRHGRRLPGNLSQVVRRYIRPYLVTDGVALDIGAGGGRWTPYLLPARKLILVELNREFFPYLERRFSAHLEKIVFYQTSGYEIDGIEAHSVDFVFSFGTFMHLTPQGIDSYIAACERVMKIGAVAILHYPDRTKRFFKSLSSREDEAIADMTAEKMLRLVGRYRFRLLTHDTLLLNHSNIMVLKRCE